MEVEDSILESVEQMGSKWSEQDLQWVWQCKIKNLNKEHDDGLRCTCKTMAFWCSKRRASHNAGKGESQPDLVGCPVKPFHRQNSKLLRLDCLSGVELTSTVHADHIDVIHLARAATSPNAPPCERKFLVPELMLDARLDIHGREDDAS